MHEFVNLFNPNSHGYLTFSTISITEAEAITNLDVTDGPISDMTGIEAFVNLDTLKCAYNPSTSLDILKCPFFKYLDCGWNTTVCSMPFPPDGFQVFMDVSPNVYFTTDFDDKTEFNSVLPVRNKYGIPKLFIQRD